MIYYGYFCGYVLEWILASNDDSKIAKNSISGNFASDLIFNFSIKLIQFPPWCSMCYCEDGIIVLSI